MREGGTDVSAISGRKKNTPTAGAPPCPNMGQMKFRPSGKDSRSPTRPHPTRFVGFRHVLGYNGSCRAGRGELIPPFDYKSGGGTSLNSQNLSNMLTDPN